MFRMSAKVVLLNSVTSDLTHDVSVLVANALVSSRLDYCQFPKSRSYNKVRGAA